MATNSSEKLSSPQLDPFVQRWLELLSNTCLLVAGIVAATILSGWRLPLIASSLPDGWALMQATTALSVLFLTVALALNKKKDNYRLYSISQIFATVCILLAGVALVEHWHGQDAVLARYFVATTLLPKAYPTSIQSASCFTVLALSLFLDYERTDRTGYIFDVLIMVLVTLNLLFVAGYIYKAGQLIQQTSAILISPQTLVCIALLTFVQAARRAPFGLYSTLVSKGAAGRTARIVLPLSVVAAYMITLSQAKLTESGLLASPYDAAITAVALAAILIIVVIFLARRIDALDSRLSNMSITDELTGVYNLRGLYLHGEQELLDAKRSTIPLTVLFIDVDGLKKVNDSLGHNVGSQLLRDVATLLRENFRDSDIVARVGGDEFAAIAHGAEDKILPVLQRVNKAVDDANAHGNKPYRIGFSIGKVAFDPLSSESLENLLSRADAAMYQDKNNRYAIRASHDNVQQFAPPDAQKPRG